jgi:hypothetical protein
LAAILLVSSSLGWAGNIAYIGDYSNGNKLQSIDLTTGAVTNIGPSSFFVGMNFSGGTLYGETVYFSSTLQTIDTATGTVCSVGGACNGTNSAPPSLAAGGATNGAMYAIGETGYTLELHGVNYSTGVATDLGSTGLEAGCGDSICALADDGTNLYLSYLDTSTRYWTGSLYRLNTSTGAATLVGAETGTAHTQQDWISSMFFDNGVLYAFEDAQYSVPGTTYLDMIDTSTGAVTQLRSLGALGAITAATADAGASTPEPATLVMMAGALAGLIALRRRRTMGVLR